MSRICFAQRVLCGEDFSRKGAKTQSAAAFLRGFLCAFAYLLRFVERDGEFF